MLENKEKIESINLNCPIFNFLKPFNNDQFSKMKGIDLQELIYYLDEYYLEFRNCLGFSSIDTFGVELELENTNKNKIKTAIKEIFDANEWVVKKDASLHKGAEINSPILIDEADTWINLKKICSIAEKSAIIGKHSGGHIHIGAQVLGKHSNSWLQFIKFWAIYENIIYRFVYNESLIPRITMKDYAYPISSEFLKIYKLYINSKTDDILRNFKAKTEAAVNFYNVKQYKDFSKKNTIEFRCPNGTLNPIIWQNNINLFMNILKYSKSSKFDDDIITKRMESNFEKYGNIYNNLNLYGEIYLDQALELADLLFKTNLDKIYFLRQYLKNFEVYRNSGEKAKQFTKK